MSCARRPVTWRGRPLRPAAARSLDEFVRSPGGLLDEIARARDVRVRGPSSGCPVAMPPTWSRRPSACRSRPSTGAAW